MAISQFPAERGEQDATELWELVKAYEPQLRRAVRVHLTCAYARRLFDSIDICQCVYLTLWQRIQEQDVRWSSSHQLFALLLGIARNKVLETLRYSHRQRRDARRTQSFREEDYSLQASASEVEQLAEERELYSFLESQLLETEWNVVRQRLSGASWVEASQGKTPDSLKSRIRHVCSQVL